MSAPHSLWSYKDKKILNVLSYSTPLSAFDLQNENILIACPNPPREAIRTGRAIALPSGQFDAAMIKSKLPIGFVPEMIHVSARNLEFLPLNLKSLGCPVVMKLGDSFYSGNGRLHQMVEYAKKMSCDFYWTYQCVHHLHFFREAGLENLIWMPPSIAIDSYIPKQIDSKTYDVVFRGSTLGVHGYRAALLELIKESRFKIDIASKHYRDCLDDYAKARIVFNCSANADTNRRIAEVLIAGGFLLTDRLSRQTGLYSLFEEGKDFECYESSQELLEKIEHYLTHPEEALRIAKSGQQKLLQLYPPDRMRNVFYEIIFSGKKDLRFEPRHDLRGLNENNNSIDTKQQSLNQRMQIYETVQELHRINSKITIHVECEDYRIKEDLSDLPRLEFNGSDGVSSGIQVLITDRGSPWALDHLEPGALVLALGSLEACFKQGFEKIKLADAYSSDLIGPEGVSIWRKNGPNLLNYELFDPKKAIWNKGIRFGKKLKQKARELRL